MHEMWGAAGRRGSWRGSQGPRWRGKHMQMALTAPLTAQTPTTPTERGHVWAAPVGNSPVWFGTVMRLSLALTESCVCHVVWQITDFPYVLTLQLKRFDFDHATMRRIKIADRVSFPGLPPTVRVAFPLQSESHSPSLIHSSPSLFSTPIGCSPSQSVAVRGSWRGQVVPDCVPPVSRVQASHSRS